MANNWLSYAGYGESAIGVAQLGMLSYRQSQPILGRVGTFSEFSGTYKGLGVAGKILGRAGTVGAVLGVGLDLKAMKDGQIGVGRFAYHTTGTGASIAIGAVIGGPIGAISGGIVGGGFWAGEKLYDGVNWWVGEMSKGITNFENALSRGWVPGK